MGWVWLVEKFINNKDLENIMERNEMFNVLNFYLERNILIHIDTSDGKFYNGTIISITESLVILDDRVVGEVPISIPSITNLERYKNKEEKNGRSSGGQ